MPSFVPRYLEPYQKKELLDKRIGELRVAIRKGVAFSRASRLAEKVRSAALAVIKAKRTILKSQPAFLGRPPGDPKREGIARQLAKLEAEAGRWNSRSTDDIVGEYTESVS